MIGHRWTLCVSLAAGLLASVAASAENPPKWRGPNATFATTFDTTIPEHVGSVVLGRPTNTSVTVSMMLNAAGRGVLVWGKDAKTLPAVGKAVTLKAGEPQEVVIGGLLADTQYVYELRNANGKRLLPVAGVGTFRTARAHGDAFTFTVTADSHLDEHTSTEVWQRALANCLADRPDFHVDLGDTFMTEKHASPGSAARQYLAQRYYFGQLCHSVPLFLVLGNHDGESPRGHNSEADSLAVWSNQLRERYFPNPVPDTFYSGDALKQPDAGLLQDYYAWEWGDGLFVVLDPFWFVQSQRGQNDNWKRSLGTEQYQWLKRTLEGSKAKYKFVFIHHLVGGLDPQSRGGAEAAGLFEWGGKDLEGKDTFGQHRPGWAMPIHQLLRKNGVNIVFHGHDHLYARQELDGVVYQEVPQPGDPRGSTRSAADYGYKAGDILPSSGHMRVSVGAEGVRVDYVRSTGENGTVAKSYVVRASQNSQ